MTSIMFGQLSSIGVPADEKVVRNTATPVDDNAPAAMQDDMPEMSEVETDPNPDLGMVNRQLASKWVQPEKTPPVHKWQVDTDIYHNEIVDRQVSSSGTAAAREASGQWGHGTAAYAVGIEPVGDLRDGGKMGNEYFKFDERPVQEGAGNYMTQANGLDRAAIGSADAAGKRNARQAAIAAQYDLFWNGGKP